MYTDREKNEMICNHQNEYFQNFITKNRNNVPVNKKEILINMFTKFIQIK